MSFLNQLKRDLSALTKFNGMRSFQVTHKKSINCELYCVCIDKKNFFLRFMFDNQSF